MLDVRDQKILSLLQEDAEQPISKIADAVNLSPSACSRRITKLKDQGYITKQVIVVDREAINLPTTVFMMVRTVFHSEKSINDFQKAIENIPEISEVHRLTGNFDYIIKITLPYVEYYDVIYKKILKSVDLHDAMAYISMETLKFSSELTLSHAK